MSRAYESHGEDRQTSGAATRRVDKSTARAFAAALSALAISTLVVSTSSAALVSRGTSAANTLESGTISLSDDDQDRSLVNLENMAPNQPRIQCIEIAYEGTIAPVELSLAATVAGDLAPFTEVTLDRGTGGGFDECESFVRSEQIFDGRLSRLAEISPISLGRIFNNGDTATFRFTFELADEQAALGRSSTTTFAWEVIPA